MHFFQNEANLKRNPVRLSGDQLQDSPGETWRLPGQDKLLHGQDPEPAFYLQRNRSVFPQP